RKPATSPPTCAVLSTKGRKKPITSVTTTKGASARARCLPSGLSFVTAARASRPPTAPKIAPEAPTDSPGCQSRLAEKPTTPETRYTRRKRAVPRMGSSRRPTCQSTHRFRPRCQTAACTKSPLTSRQISPCHTRNATTAPTSLSTSGEVKKSPPPPASVARNVVMHEPTRAHVAIGGSPGRMAPRELALSRPRGHDGDGRARLASQCIVTPLAEAHAPPGARPRHG